MLPLHRVQYSWRADSGDAGKQPWHNSVPHPTQFQFAALSA
jgi:hypothetical protein